MESGLDTILFLALMDFIFILVTGTMLCFGFSMRKMLITQRCFWLLLSSVFSELRTFQCPILCQWAGAQEGYFITQNVMSKYINGRELCGRGPVAFWAGHQSVRSEQLYCASLLSLFYSLLFIKIITVVIIIITVIVIFANFVISIVRTIIKFYISSIIKWFLFQPIKFMLFPGLPFPLEGVEERDQMCDP